MEDISNSSTEVEVGKNDGTPEGQVQEVKEEVVPLKDYTALQSQSTKWRQSQIETAVKLVSKDKSEINNLNDEKLKDIVAKQVFGYNTFEEMVAIEGSDFAKQDIDIGWDEDKIRTLEKQVKVLSYQTQVKELDNAIARYKAANQDYFKDETAEGELREKLKLITWAVDIDERVRLAGTIVFANKIDTTSLAYKALANANIGEWSSVGDEVKTKTDKKSEDIIKFLFKK